MASTSRRLQFAGIAAAVLFAGCSHRVPNGGEWASEPAVRSGSSLPRLGLQPRPENRSRLETHPNSELNLPRGRGLLEQPECG